MWGHLTTQDVAAATKETQRGITRQSLHTTDVKKLHDESIHLLLAIFFCIHEDNCDSSLFTQDRKWNWTHWSQIGQHAADACLLDHCAQQLFWFHVLWECCNMSWEFLLHQVVLFLWWNSTSELGSSHDCRKGWAFHPEMHPPLVDNDCPPHRFARAFWSPDMLTVLP